jgi:hypothetical protein
MPGSGVGYLIKTLAYYELELTAEGAEERRGSKRKSPQCPLR